MSRRRDQRSQAATRARNFGITEAVDALLASPQLYEVATVFPQAADTGRRRHYPPLALLIFDALIHIYGSAYKVAAELDYLPSGLWKKIRRNVKRRTGTRLPKRPPKRHHYRYAKDTYLTDPAVLAGLSVVIITTGLKAAQEIGLLKSDTPTSRRNPSSNNTIAGDVTVIKATNKPTAPLRPPSDTFLLKTGDDRWLQGHPFAIFTARGDDPDTRIVLGAMPLPKAGSEMTVVLDLLDETIRASRELDGIRIDAFVYDGAMRGTHMDRIQQDHGIAVVSPVAKLRDAQERNDPLGPLTDPADASHSHADMQLRAVRGHVQVYQPDAHGELVLLEGAARRFHVKTTTTANRKHRHQIGYRLRLPCGCRQERWFRTWSKNGDPFSYPESIRVIPPDDPHYAEIYGRRNDAESTNNSFKRAFQDRRGRANTRNGNWLHTLTFAITSNAKTRWATQDLATGDPPAAIAA